MEMSSGTIPVLCEGGRVGQEKKLNCDAFATEASASSTGSPGSFNLFQIEARGLELLS